MQSPTCQHVDVTFFGKRALTYGLVALVATSLAIPNASATPVVPGQPAVPSVPAAPAVPAVRVDLAPRGSRKLVWRSCPTTTMPTQECATLAVPFDYTRPNKGNFRLAVARIPATEKKAGSLFLNPGGPGGSGVGSLGGIASLMAPSLRAKFDIVSWDPRGIGATKPALRGCATPFAARPTSGPVNWTSVRAGAAAALGRANRVCQQRNQRFINHMGTNDAVRDLDALRAAVGDRKLNYWGLSYGTRIGYVYALAYPGRVRAMVLDGNIDPKGNYADLTQGGTAPDSALEFIKGVSQPSYDSVISTRDSLDAAPIDLGDGIVYTRWSYLDTIMNMVAAQFLWPAIVQFGDVVQGARLGGEAGEKSRAVLRSTIPTENSNAGGAFSVVNCLDYADRMSVSAQDSAVTGNIAAAPVFGGSLTTDFAIGCAGLKLRTDPVPTTNSKTNLARIRGLPIIVSNATHDASTPLIWANRMASSFPSAAYLKYRSGQHVVWNFTASTCVNDRINNYMLSLNNPHSVTCAFAPPPGLSPS